MHGVLINVGALGLMGGPWYCMAVRRKEKETVDAVYRWFSKPFVYQWTSLVLFWEKRKATHHPE